MALCLCYLFGDSMSYLQISSWTVVCKFYFCKCQNNLEKLLYHAQVIRRCLVSLTYYTDMTHFVFVTLGEFISSVLFS